MVWGGPPAFSVTDAPEKLQSLPTSSCAKKLRQCQQIFGSKSNALCKNGATHKTASLLCGSCCLQRLSRSQLPLRQGHELCRLASNASEGSETVEDSYYGTRSPATLPPAWCPLASETERLLPRPEAWEAAGGILRCTGKSVSRVNQLLPAWQNDKHRPSKHSNLQHSPPNRGQKKKAVTTMAGRGGGGWG